MHMNLGLHKEFLTEALADRMIEPFPLEGIYAITPSFKKNELAYLEKIEETVRAGVSALQIREKYS